MCYNKNEINKTTFFGGIIMEKIISSLCAFVLIVSLFALVGCGKTDKSNNTSTTAPVSTTEKAPGKYADSEFVGSWYNADAEKNEIVCKLNDDGTATFKADKKATWEETQTGITITTKVEGKKTTLEGYFVIAGDGYVARATEANMHYLDEGGELQLEIMLTKNTCVDCIKK